MKVLLAVVLFPLAEIAAVVFVAQWTGIWLALLFLALGSVCGAIILRRQGAGLRLAKELRGAFQPVSLVAHRALVILGGLLLFIPGFISGLFGVLLLIPWVRIVLIGAIARRFVVKRQTASGAGDVVDGDFVVIKPAAMTAPPKD